MEGRGEGMQGAVITNNENALRKLRQKGKGAGVSNWASKKRQNNIFFENWLAQRNNTNFSTVSTQNGRCLVL